ncbi:hypothetical protein ACFQ1S_14205 [Kibdelosporangium lantanae]|uniref:Secreted protein n=1 Tax=Kibdelosporangium lantanae TaxID=1497396 RepID=A0ABW3M7Q6_9PSEU
MKPTSLLATVAAAILAVTAPTAEAAKPPLGGGCYDHSKHNNWDIGVCISNRNTDTQVYPDIYVNTVGTRPAGCFVRVYAKDDNLGRVARTNDFPCEKGHYEIPHFNATPAHLYHTEVEVMPAGYVFDISPGIVYY